MAPTAYRLAASTSAWTESWDTYRDDPDDWLDDVMDATRDSLTDTQGNLILAGTGFYNRDWLNVSSATGNPDNDLHGNIRYYVMHNILKNLIGIGN